MTAVEPGTRGSAEIPAATGTEECAATGQQAHADFISHEEMLRHQRQGEAEPLSRIITDFVTYGGQWWIADEDGWHVIDDKHLIAKLNNHATWADGTLYGGSE